MNNIKSTIDYVISPYVDTWKCLIRDTGRHEHNVEMTRIANQKLAEITVEPPTDEESESTESSFTRYCRIGHDKAYEIDAKLLQVTHYTTLAIGCVAIARAVSLIAVTIFAILTVATLTTTTGFTSLVLTTALAIPTIILHDIYQIVTTAQRAVTGMELCTPIWRIIQDLFVVAISTFRESSQLAFKNTFEQCFAENLSSELNEEQVAWSDQAFKTASTEANANKTYSKKAFERAFKRAFEDAYEKAVPENPNIFDEATQHAYERATKHTNFNLKVTINRLKPHIKQTLEKRGIEDIGWPVVKNIVRALEKNTILVHALYRTITNPDVENKIKDGIHHLKNDTQK